MVDLDGGEIVLFDRVVDGRFADPVGDGARVTWSTGGLVVEVALTDLR